MPYGGTAPELDPPDEPPLDDVPDDPPLDEVPDDPPLDPPDVPEEPPEVPEDPEDDVDDVEDELVSSLPPHAASAVALANKIAARVATRPVGGDIAPNAGSSASQNGHDVSLARTCRLQSGQGLRLATKEE